MDINTYAKRKQALLGRMLSALVYVFRQFITPFMTPRQWIEFLRVTYRIMKQHRDEATELAREFYDDNRAEQLPDVEPQKIFKDDHYPIEWFQETMAPVLERFERTRNVDAAIQETSARIVKVVEDAGRRTILRGLSEDVDAPIRGFARFDPRPPTCAFCTMMISRGPVYSHDTAGFKGSQETAAELWRENDTDAMNELMHKWHPDCTCIAVPVYKLSGYPTERQELDAFEIYKEARKRAKAKGDVSYKAILKQMRKDLRIPSKDEDEAILTQSVA
jgi:hypothetical protein